MFLLLLALTFVSAQTPLGFFLSSLPENATGMFPLLSSFNASSFQNYRLIPGKWHEEMAYHFDGLAFVMKLDYEKKELIIQPYHSEQYDDFDSCIIAGVGFTKALGDRVCFRNPVVNLLPFQKELWLTIDTDAWGRIDPETLATIPGKTKIDSVIMNAHPACDPITKACFVEGACGGILPTPWHRDSCVFSLESSSEGLVATEISRLRLPHETLLQHSHSLCLTPNYLLVKLDRFFLHKSDAPEAKGMLAKLQQEEKNLWLLMDRKTNKSSLLQGNESEAFVNNHFWNCYDDQATGEVVVESVRATQFYLDQYFDSELSKSTTMWNKLFKETVRCFASPNGIKCNPYLKSPLIFDYPTFNPLWKTNADYRYFYAISPVAQNSSRWFDSIIKIDRIAGIVVHSFTQPNTFYTEADFVPGPNSDSVEDDGFLISVSFNQSSKQSFALILNATDLTLVDSTPLPFVIPFHAHGIIKKGARFYNNP